MGWERGKHLKRFITRVKHVPANSFGHEKTRGNTLQSNTMMYTFQTDNNQVLLAVQSRRWASHLLIKGTELVDASLSCSDVARTGRMVCDDEISNHTRRTSREISTSSGPADSRPQQNQDPSDCAGQQLKDTRACKRAIQPCGKGACVCTITRGERGEGRERAVHRERMWCK